MDFKKVLIGVAIVGGLYWIYTKTKKTGTTTSTTGTSNASGAQLMAIAKGAKTPQFRCNCGAIVAGPAACADACAGMK